MSNRVRPCEERARLGDRYGQVTNRTAPVKFVPWAAAASRYQACAQTTSPAENGAPSANGCASRHALKSSAISPSQAPAVPPEPAMPVRCRGGATQLKLVLPHGLWIAPLMP